MFDDGLDLAKMTDVFNRKANYCVGYIADMHADTRLDKKGDVAVCLPEK